MLQESSVVVENLIRENLNYIQEAEHYRNLIQEHGLKQEVLASKIGKSQSTIANKIRLLRLPPMVLNMLTVNGLTERHARALLKLNDEKKQIGVLEQVCRQKLNVKQTEILVQKALLRKEDVLSSAGGSKDNSIDTIRSFVCSVKSAVDQVRQSGVDAKAAQIDRGEYVEFVVRIPKRDTRLK